jgi:hypothetical protein
VDLRVRVEKMTAEKLVNDDVDDKDVIYRVNVSMVETEKNPGWTGISFSFDITSEPAVARLQISGTAALGGTKEEVLPFLTSGTQAPPAVLAEIYERVYGTIYVICAAIQVPHPLPNLLRE